MASIKRNLVLGSLLAGALAIPGLASADDAAATPVATPTPLAWYQKVQVGGYVDAYYQLNLNQASSTSPLSLRAYNSQVNEFTYGGGELTLQENDSDTGTGYFVDLLLGSINSTYDGAAAYGEDNLGVDLGQAYITQAFGNATFTLGKFATPIGYESTYLPSDANFSRSLLYEAEPTFQTGLELSYKLPASLTAAVWVDNGASLIVPSGSGLFQGIGFSSLDQQNNNGKGYGAQLGYNGVKNLSLTGTWYYIDNVLWAGVNTPIGHVDLTDAVASYAVADDLSFAGEYLNETVPNQTVFTTYGQQQGYALYATYSPIANLSLSPRFTQWFNPNLGNPADSLGGATIIPYQLDDYTVTLKYQMGPLAHILEYEATAANLDVYASGKDGATPNKVQQTLTYAAVYSF